MLNNDKKCFISAYPAHCWTRAISPKINDRIHHFIPFATVVKRSRFLGQTNQIQNPLDRIKTPKFISRSQSNRINCGVQSENKNQIQSVEIEEKYQKENQRYQHTKKISDQVEIQHFPSFT